ncbi:hypothetical protein BDR07DRAFT_1492954 [Suillus spraguei]|nr:hypothetical protein BDR07DRAFT_1492954 [Suillus spraguei]
MSDSSYSQSSTLNEEEQREILQQRFPLAGYWFNMLPTHPFIHGVENMLSRVPALSQPSQQSKRPHQAVSVTRNREEIGTSDQDPTTLSFAAEFCELKSKLDCTKHPGKYCYVSPISGGHKAQDIYSLTLWAKKIFLSKATYEKPPETAVFDHVSKKHWVSSTTSASQPEIHVHLPQTITQPLSDISGERHINTSHTWIFSTPVFCGDDDDEFSNALHCRFG